MTEIPCPGPENRDYREAEAAYRAAVREADRLAETGLVAVQHPEPHGIRPRHGDPVWCHACSHRIQQALAELPDLYVRLELDKRNGTTTAGGEHVSGSKAPPSPSPLADEQDDLVAWLTAWEDTIRQLRGYTARPQRLPLTQQPPSSPPVSRRAATWQAVVSRRACPWPRPRTDPGSAANRESVTLVGAHRFLTAHLPDSLADELIGPDLGRGVLRRAARLRSRVRTDLGRSRKPVPCPRCRLRTLVHEQGAEYIGCENPECGRLLKLDEYDDLAASVARSQRGGRIGA